MGVEVRESPGAKFISYRIVSKGERHDKRFDSSSGSFHESGGWIYFKIFPPITYAPQITSEKDFNKGVYALAETAAGEKIPLQIDTRSDRNGLIAISLPARFPPTIKDLDIILFDRKRLLSKIHLNKLPRTIWKTWPDAKPSLVYNAGAVKVKGSAHVELPKSSSGWSWLIYRLNLNGVAPEKNWRVTDLRAVAPYQSPDAVPDLSFGGGSVSFELHKHQSYATAQWAPYNALVKRITVECSLDRFDIHEETADFGIVQIQKDTNPNTTRPDRALYLTLTKPIVRVLKDGTKLTLTPMLNSKDQNIHYLDETLYIRLSAEPNRPTLMDGNFVIECRLESASQKYFSRLFPELNTNTSFPNLQFIEWKSGKKQIHLKFNVRTLKRIEHHPISLTLPVNPLTEGKPDKMSPPQSDFWPTSTSMN